MTSTANENGDVINETTGRKVLGTQISDAPLGEVHVSLTKIADTCRAEAYCRTHIVPIVFVPGIMGSNLIGSVTNEKGEQVDAFAWAPDNLLGTAWHYINASPDTRQKALNPLTTRVSHSVKKGPEIFEKPLTKEQERNSKAVKDSKEFARKLAEQRGWGTVYNGSYWPLLIALEQLLNANPRDMIDPFDGKSSKADGKKDKHGDSPEIVWDELYKDGKIGYKDSTRLHMMNGEATPLTVDNIKHAACYQYPVYAAGYNWLRSNYDSATGADEWSLKNTVKRIIDENKKHDPSCEKAIIVTHSMGGLVTRAYSKSDESGILGVIHGVMPAVGAPPMYKRMRAGFGGVELDDIDTGFLSKIKPALFAFVVGNDAHETAAVLASCMGALELAPTMDYGKQKPSVRQWLRIQNADGSEVRLPKEDPYYEIYLTHHWYSLLPLLKDENPTETRNTRVNPTGLDFKMSDLAYFAENIKLAREFHATHMPYKYYHPNSFVSYLAQLKAFETITWKVVGGRESDSLQDSGQRIRDLSQIEPITPEDVDAHTLETDDIKGSLNVRHNRQVKHLQVQGQGNERGDGTVPEDSGKAPLPFVKAIFEQGVPDPKKDHQESWGIPAARRMALYSVVKIMKDDKRATQ